MGEIPARIQQLEASLGTKLFVREKRRLHLSPAGKVFLSYVERILSISDEAREAIAEHVPQGVFRIGTLESTATSDHSVVRLCATDAGRARAAVSAA